MINQIKAGRAPWRRWFECFACGLVFSAAAAPAHPQQTTVTLDPTRTKVEFTLGATAHTVHGTFALKRGEVRFDLTSGKAAGEIVVNARSGDTDNSGRDRKMHEEVLESGKWAEIVFVPSRVQGAITTEGVSQLQVTGTFRLLGQEHEMTLPFSVQVSSNNQLEATTHFAVPYVQWGLKNPSNFLLRVDKSVEVEVHAAGAMNSSAPAPHRTDSEPR